MLLKPKQSLFALIYNKGRLFNINHNASFYLYFSYERKNNNVVNVKQFYSKLSLVIDNIIK